MSGKIYSFLMFFTLFFAFAQDNVSIKATITNRNSDFLFIRDFDNNLIKEIEVKDGVFFAKFPIEEGIYYLNDGVEYTEVYLKNGYDLNINVDAKMFDETINYIGIGAEENNYLAIETIKALEINLTQMVKLSVVDYEKFIEKEKKPEYEKIENSGFSSAFKINKKKNLDAKFKFIEKFYDDYGRNKVVNNAISPSFDYLNYEGKKSKLEDFKEKYIYIDVWATWCGPCRQQMPYLKEIEEKYKDKKIEFISISIDKLGDIDKWKNFIELNCLSGVQLIADNEYDSDFIKAYGIAGIPRFILIDPTGNVVNADAERPSNPKLIEILDKLLN